MDIAGRSHFQVGDGNTQDNSTYYNVYVTAQPSIQTQPVGTWWSEVWYPFTDPQLTAEIVLAGRQEAAAAVHDALSGDEPIISIGGDLSVMEMKAFLAAALDSSPSKGRAVFVADPSALAALLQEPEAHILLLVAESAPPGLPITGTHKIVLYGRQASHPSVIVPAVDGDAVEKLLMGGGVRRDRARQYGPLARRGLEQLRHCLSRFPQHPEAQWAINPTRTCRRLSLLGEFSGLDSDVLMAFAELSYADLPDRVRHLVTDPDLPLLGILSDHWYVQDPENAVRLLIKGYTGQDLTAFAELAVPVLTGIQPVSPRLRCGVARTLALLAVHSGDVRNGSSGQPVASLVDAVVARMLTDAPTATWAEMTTATADCFREKGETVR